MQYAKASCRFGQLHISIYQFLSSAPKQMNISKTQLHYNVSQFEERRDPDTLQFLVNASINMLHSFFSGSYASMVLRNSLPSKPPTAQSTPFSTARPALLRADVMLPSILHSFLAGSIDLHTAQSVRAIKSSNHKQLPWKQLKCT